MELLVTYGALAVFFVVVVAILQRSYVADRDFSDFTVAGRSFGGFYQAMAFLNTGLPGFMYLGAFGFIVRAGVLDIGISTLLATVLASEEIAPLLNLSQKTVRNHHYAIKAKIGRAAMPISSGSRLLRGSCRLICMAQITLRVLGALGDRRAPERLRGKTGTCFRRVAAV